MARTSYTQDQFKVFAQDLPTAYVEAGFEIVEEPYIDEALNGFRATYIRRYTLHQPTLIHDGVMTTILHVVGLPFGHHGEKMVVISAPRDLKNLPLSESIKLRIRFNDEGVPSVVKGEQSRSTNNPANENETKGNSFALQFRNYLDSQLLNSRFGQKRKNNQQFYRDLAEYVAHIIETISPGLIELPTEMKLEILKKLSVDSIVKMSQVNNEFRTLIFKRGESLWRHLCFRDFAITQINRFVHQSWMQLYRDNYVIHQIEICRKERALPSPPERPALPAAPLRPQIGWLPEVLELPWNPENQVQLALEFHPLLRADSLDSLA